MSSLNYSPPVKEENICWTEKEALVKEEADTIQEQVEGGAVKEVEEDAFRVEDEDLFGMKDEEGEITVTLEEDEEEKSGDLINTRKYREYYLIKQGH
jgi:hypothetical protein